jgi:hypothetical protein
MIKTKWNVEAVKAYETGQGVELVNEPYPHYEPLTKESEKQEQDEPKKWVGLTDAEIQECLQGLPTQTIDVYARSIEAKLKDKNT